MLGLRAHLAELPMSSPPGVERLNDSRYVVVLVRMLLDPQGRLVHGDVGGVPDEEGNERWIHFHGVDGLLPAVQAWLAADR
jgi:hypothetical protein